MILCYSGTGNSRYIAQRIADELQDNIIDLNEKIKTNNYSSIEIGDDVILVVLGVFQKLFPIGFIKLNSLVQNVFGLL